MITDQHPCLTIDEYASQIEKFFLNNSIFSFDPGNHSLNIGLNISGIHNVSFIGLPDSSVTIVVLNRSSCISWENCENIEIANINFVIESNFSCVLSFNSTFCVKLSNITILGNGHIGCSSIISKRSIVDISDSTFTGIRGYYGAALTALRSNITFAGNNSFLKNNAESGGAMFLYGSAVLFNGTSTFYKNSASFGESDLEARNECFSIDYSISFINNLRNFTYFGGALSLCNSTIIVMDYSSETSATSEFSFAIFNKCYPMNDSDYEHIDNQTMQDYRSKCNANQIDLPCSCSKHSTRNHIPTLKFYYNFAENGGGSLFSLNSYIKVVGIVEFVRNSARYAGGALHLIETYFCYIRSPCLTCYVDHSLQFSSQLMFLNNSAIVFGGALYIADTNYMFYGSISLVNNSAKYGGALYIVDSSTSLNVKKYSSKRFSGYITFRNNFARIIGGAIFLENSANMQIYGSVSLVMNYAVFSSGAIHLNYSTLQICGSVSLAKSNATTRGGGIVLLDSTMQIFGDVSLASNNATFGGAIVLTKSTMLMCGRNSLVENSATTKGGAIYLNKATVQMCGSVTLAKNKANIGGAVYTKASNISIGVNCSNIHVWSNITVTVVVFQLNTATYSGGSISSIDSHLYFMGSALFDGNTAGFGGAMILDGTSKLKLKPNLKLSFVNNRANENGGIFYYDHSVSSCDRFLKFVYSDYHSQCFISFEDVSVSPALNNNSASKAGSLLYSGKLGTCYRDSSKNSIFEGCGQITKQNFCTNLHLTFVNKPNSVELISADTEDLKFCQFQDNFTISKNVLVSVYPGEKFNISLIAVGTFNLPVSTRILHNILFPTDKKIELRQVELLTKVSSIICSNVSYYLLVQSITNQLTNTVNAKIYHKNPCDSLVDGVNLYINIKSCPLGFELSNEHQKCTCDKWLQKFDITECNIDDLSIERKKNTFWISKLANHSGLILHDGRCPFDFCKDNFVNVSLSNPSAQCDFNRNGTLCGQCKEQYSLALGTLHCIKCVKSSYVTLVIPFALAGIALVMVILLLHLTVDVGTLNGLIFYANIVHSNREAYFQHTKRMNNFPSLFISWLNLDFGIETCFYNGMDIYSYSWLQFLFPFYVWFLIGAIIFVCRYSQRVSRSLGRNPVAALGTVLFLSYGKILNAIIAPLSKTEFIFKSNDGSNSTHSVWLYDGNVEYFTDPKHIALGLFAILILLLAFVPYTFILLCGHMLIAYSDKCLLSWLNKIKPFMDVYYAPFKQEARYWIGLTLLARSVLLLTIAINAVGSDSVNLLVIVSVTAGVLSMNGRVYENKYNEILESSFILNLCVLSVATFYLKDKNIESQPAVLSASVGISFVIFIGILFFHIHLLFKSKNVWEHVVNSLLHKKWLLCKAFKMVPKEDENVALKGNVPEVVTSTLVELREPLIDNDDV